MTFLGFLVPFKYQLFFNKLLLYSKCYISDCITHQMIGHLSSVFSLSVLTCWVYPFFFFLKILKKKISSSPTLPPRNVKSTIVLHLRFFFFFFFFCLCLPGLLLPVCLSLKQATADPHLCRRPSNTQRQV